MLDASDFYGGIGPSGSSSNLDFWYKLYAGKKADPFGRRLKQEEEQKVTAASNLEADWGYVFKNLPKDKNTKRRKRDYGHGSTVNSASDLSEALSSISAALSLSSSDSGERDDDSHGEGEDEKAGEDEEMPDWVKSSANVSSNSIADDIMTSSSDGYLQGSSAIEICGIMEQEKVQVPQIGMEFSSEEEAYEFYKSYAEASGFRVRKGKVQRCADGSIRKRYFFCSRQGFRSKKQLTKKTKYKRKETRMGCNAQVCCTAEDGKWVLTHCSFEHNHELVSQQHMNQTTTRSSEANLMIHRTEETEMAELCGKACSSKGSNIKECNLQCEDVLSLLNCFKSIQTEDSSFLYEVKLDANDVVSNVFWTEGVSKMNYECFGDVLVLDPTFKIDGHGRISMLLWGVNHHQRYTLFGCALLLDESTDSFIWLFEAFVKAMGIRSQLKTVITDENQAMADAVKSVLPGVQHQIGIWYIRQNASKNLSSLYEKPSFKILFEECISGGLPREQFASRWESLVEKFDLHKNPWLNSLYQSRERWAYTFDKKTFYAGIQHNGINNIFESSESNAIDLASIVRQYLDTARKQRMEELCEDFYSKENAQGEMLSASPMEKQAADTYTRTMFRHFQEQFVKCWSLSLKEVVHSGSDATYEFTEDCTKKSIVEVDSLNDNITCSCKKFETEGILCAHALKVLNSLNIFYIPPQHILKRWTKSARGTDNWQPPMNFLLHNTLNAIAKMEAVGKFHKLAANYLDIASKTVEEVLLLTGTVLGKCEEREPADLEHVVPEPDNFGEPASYLRDYLLRRKAKRMRDNLSNLSQDEVTKDENLGVHFASQLKVRADDDGTVARDLLLGLQSEIQMHEKTIKEQKDAQTGIHSKLKNFLRFNLDVTTKDTTITKSCSSGAAARERRSSRSNIKKRAGKSSSSSHSYIGVRQRVSGRWVAEMKEEAKSGAFRTWLGSYKTAEEAAMAYDRAAVSQCLVGKPRLNFPERLNFPYKMHSL